MCPKAEVVKLTATYAKNLSCSHQFAEARDDKAGAAVCRCPSLLVFFAPLAFAVVRIRSGPGLRIGARPNSRAKGHDFERGTRPGFSSLSARSCVDAGFNSARQRLAGSFGHYEALHPGSTGAQRTLLGVARGSDVRGRIVAQCASGSGASR